MPVYDATPATWTLKFKHQRTTVVLHIDKLQTLSSIKTELLHALRSTNPDGRLNGTALPASADDIEFARPRDFSDVEAGGWQSIELDAVAADDIDAELFDGGAAGEGKGKGKGKGKARARAAGGGGSSHRDCPLGAGLKDMCAVAFRFKGQKPASGSAAAAADDEDIDEGLGLEEEDEAIDAEGWDVELPRFQDEYGLENLVPDDQLTTPKADKFATWA